MLTFKNNILMIFLVIISGCQQCLLEYQMNPQLGFSPQSRVVNSGNGSWDLNESYTDKDYGLKTQTECDSINGEWYGLPDDSLASAFCGDGQYSQGDDFTDLGEEFYLDIIVEEFESPFFGMTFQLTFDPTKIDSFTCRSQGIENSFFGQNYLAQFINPDGNSIYSSISLLNGQDPVAGSGTIARCTGYAKSAGTAKIEFVHNSFYFIDEFGDELLNPLNTDTTYRANYDELDSSLIIFDFELIDARIDIDHPGIIDN
tara:strand:- start:180 stop:953 length:774 start_codon:yes stop_codon:yes gene_type:complete